MKFVSSFVHRSAFAALFVAAATFGAGCDGPGDPGADAGPEQNCDAYATPQVCDNDRTCVGGFCDKVDDDDIPFDEDLLGCCLRVVCLSNADCADNEKCDVRRGLCVPKNLCDPAAENGGLCEGADCCQDGQLCEYVDGAPSCVNNPPAAETCFIAAGGRPVAVDAGDTEGFPAVTAAGQDLQLEGVGFAANGSPVPHTTFTWTGANAQGVVVAPACAAGVCDLEVTATTVNGGASCTALVRVYAEPTDNRIVVLDLATGEPLSGVDVAASTGGVVTAGTTDANGAAEFPGAIDAISAFPDTHQWHTILGPPNDVLIYTARVPQENQVAGIKGTFDFDSVHTQGDIKLGLSGTAIASSITDLNFATLIGDIADYNVELEGITEEGGQLVPLPSGLVINLGDNPIKGDYVTFGEPGPNIGWAIGGQVPLAEVGPIISGVATGGGDVNIGSILGGVLPFFARFDHAIVPGLNLTNTTRPVAPGEDEPVPFGDWDFEEHIITPNTLLALSAPYTMPARLPCSPGAGVAPACDTFASGAVLLSGVIVPGIGLVPLGLTAGLDDPDENPADVDGQIDSTQEGVEKGVAVIDYAPPHDGLEGNTFVSVAIALDLDAIGGDAGDFGASIITHVTKKFSPENNVFPQDFLESQGGTFTPGAAGGFTLAPTGTADFWRVNFSDSGDVEWNVWFSDDAALINVDELHPDPAAAAARVVDADIQAFVLGTGYENIGPAPSTFAELFAFDGKDIDNLLYYLGAWSSEACKDGGHCAAPAK